MNYQGWIEAGSEDGCFRRGSVGKPGEGVRLQGTAGGSGRRAPGVEHLFLWELC